ncbi:hypothetical protein QYB45_002875 [Clostridium perfringens]|nr:hypothetical protein [Clostridium perfringens]
MEKIYLEKKDKFIKIRVTKTQRKKLKELAKKHFGMNLSEVLLYGAMKLISEKESINNDKDLINRVEK